MLAGENMGFVLSFIAEPFSNTHYRKLKTAENIKEDSASVTQAPQDNPLKNLLRTILWKSNAYIIPLQIDG